MKKFIIVAIETDESGEYCSVACDSMKYKNDTVICKENGEELDLVEGSIANKHEYKRYDQCKAAELPLDEIYKLLDAYHTELAETPCICDDIEECDCGRNDKLKRIIDIQDQLKQILEKNDTL